MKKLNNKQMKEIKAGKLTGALVTGIAGCIKVVFSGIVDVTNSICGWVMGFKEAGKGHDKMTLKMGNTNISYDDTTSVKADHDLESQKIKSNKVDVKHEKLVYEALPASTHDLGNYQEHTALYSDDTNVLVNSESNVFDNFMHF